MKNNSESEFVNAASNADHDKLLDIIDSLMDEIAILSPKKYADVMRQIHNAANDR
ncbi:hypothetical protein ACTND3_12045 [Bacillota bacterium HCP28S3_F12]